jgi:putative MATE family efflux protein
MEGTMEAGKHQDLTTGSPLRILIRLAAPISLSLFLETAFNIMNGLWVGGLGTKALAAVGMAGFPVWLFYCLLGMVSTGTTSTVAQLVGAGKAEEADRVAQQGIFAAVSLSILMAGMGIIYARSVFTAMGAEPDVVAVGTKYLTILLILSPFTAASEIFHAVLRGHGNTRTPTFVYTVGFAVNFILDPLLIYGLVGFPRLEVAGAACATVISFILSFFLDIYLLQSGRLEFRITREVLKPRWRALGGILRIGFPTSVSSALFSLVYMVITGILFRLGGDAAVASLTVGHRIESLAWIFCFSISTATVTIVGQNLGAGLADRAERCALTAAGFSAAVMAVVSAALIAGAPYVVPLFLRDNPGAVHYGIDYLRWIGGSLVFMAVAMTIDGAFSGAGDTLPPSLISIPLTLARIPMSVLLAFHFGMGVDGVWATIAILVVLRSTITILWFRRGTWKRARAVEAQGIGVAAEPSPVDSPESVGLHHE